MFFHRINIFWMNPTRSFAKSSRFLSFSRQNLKSLRHLGKNGEENGRCFPLLCYPIHTFHRNMALVGSRSSGDTNLLFMHENFQLFWVVLLHFPHFPAHFSTAVVILLHLPALMSRNFDNFIQFRCSA